MSKVILHVDVNSAYLAWESVYRLSKLGGLDLRTVPSIVGGDPKKRSGIVLAKSQPAKAYDIQTGETLVAAFQKCPSLVVVPPNYSLYMKASNAMTDILKRYSPDVQRYSIDECFVDLSKTERIWGDPVALADTIRETIRDELGFTVSVGVSSNKLLAKVASDIKKPDAVTTLFPEEIEAKMWPLPVEDLFMVGRATAPKLHKLGIFTIGDLARYDTALLSYRLKSHGIMIQQYARGIEDSAVRASNRLAIKGLGNSSTIPFDVTERSDAHKILLSLSETVGMRLRDSGYCARLVSIGIKTSEFGYYGHQHKFDVATDSTKFIFEEARRLFDEVWQGEAVRHLGVRVSEFCDNDWVQMSFWDSADTDKQRALDRCLDQIRMKYDSKAVIRACFLNSGIKPLMGGIGEEDYPLMSSIL